MERFGWREQLFSIILTEGRRTCWRAWMETHAILFKCVNWIWGVSFTSPGECTCGRLLILVKVTKRSVFCTNRINNGRNGPVDAGDLFCISLRWASLVLFTPIYHRRLCLNTAFAMQTRSDEQCVPNGYSIRRIKRFNRFVAIALSPTHTWNWSEKE